MRGAAAEDEVAVRVRVEFNFFEIVCDNKRKILIPFHVENMDLLCFLLVTQLVLVTNDISICL